MQCLSQKQIEDYNEKIGDNNYLINLYNQLKQKEKDFKKLSPFKMLSKQIGCGEKKEFIKLITSPEELKKILKEIKDAGQKYFVEHTEHETVVDFIHLLQNRENYE
ncbi:MAG: hypothetical protein LBG52_06575 [Candidatus Peribacteria bacterium]|nr:hypothetical protein [Candidatus Peribacteria bacterium]